MGGITWNQAKACVGIPGEPCHHGPRGRKVQLCGPCHNYHRGRCRYCYEAYGHYRDAQEAMRFNRSRGDQASTGSRAPSPKRRRTDEWVPDPRTGAPRILSAEEFRRQEALNRQRMASTLMDWAEVMR